MKKLTQVCSGLIAAYALLAAGVSIFGKPLARKHSAILDVLSFQKGPLSWTYSFDSGDVGPFTVGSTREAVLRAAVDSRCFFAYPEADQEPRVELTTMPRPILAEYFPTRGIRLLSVIGNAETFELTFAEGKLANVRRTNSPFMGL